ncbi:hypothetical protein [uncultured Bartonella sp.]|uniref:hypothetical protein n=1 Tax=uncultured Bartonella sp. TaxID=104108 RepID=UPI002631AF03|nr:hypothetical protein [uncultured Bartonella sp.]
MPKAVNSISTTAPKIQYNSVETAQAYNLDRLYDLSSGLQAYRIMLCALLDTNSGVGQISDGISYILDCLIGNFDCQTDDIKKAFKKRTENVNEQAAINKKSFEEEFAKEIETIQTILRDGKKAENKDVDC